MDAMGQPAIAAVFTDNAPSPAGHYAQAILHGDTIYVSGQLPVAPNGDHDPAAAFDDQARRALANLLAIVEAAGGSGERILKVTAYIVGVEHWPSFNAVYAEVFGSAQPARSVVPVPELHHGYLVEVDAIAATGSRPRRRGGAT